MLAFHALTPQVPSEVWLMLGPKAHAPKLEWPPVRVSRVMRPYQEALAA